MNTLGFKDLNMFSIEELQVELQKELQNIENAKQKFERRKMEISLNYKKISPKAHKINTLVDFTLGQQPMKTELIKRIQAARAEVNRIEKLTAQLGNIAFSEFERTFNVDLTDSKVVRILRNLHATEEDIEAMLLILRGDEDYEEIRDQYNTYKIDQIEAEGGVTVPDEEAIDFFANRWQ